MTFRLIAISLLISLKVAGQPAVLDSLVTPYLVTTDNPYQPLDYNLLVFADTAGEYAIDRLLTEETWTERLLPYHELSHPLRSFQDYWGVVKIESELDLHEWQLVFDNRTIFRPGWGRGNSIADVYELDMDGQKSLKRSGSDLPASEKEIKERWNNNRVSLSLKAEESRWIFIRVRNNNMFPPDLGIKLVNASVFLQQSELNKFSVWYAIYIGIAIMAFIYHLLLFVFVREKALGWLTGWLFCIAIAMMLVHPYDPVTEFVLKEKPLLRWGVWGLFSDGVWIIFWFFGRSFAKTRDLYPKIDLWIRGLLVFVIISSLFFVGTLFLFPETQRDGFYLPVWISVILIQSIVGIGIVVALFSKGQPYAKIFSVGAFIGILAPLVGMMARAGLFKLNFDPYVAGFLVQILIYSLALAYRRYILEKEKQEAFKLKELDVIKSRFFANISHELRTPLTLIVSPLQQLISGNYQGDKKTLFKTMQRNGDRLLNLVNQLLDLSKLESGKMKLQVEKGDVVQFLKTLVFSFESMAERRQIHFQTHFPDETHLSFFDRDKLEKIVVNLLSNAFKYTPERGHVSVFTEVEESRLRISIEDSGHGISKEELDKIFDRFYQVEGTEDKGTGIGLSLVKELVDLHKGTIHVNSAPGKGTQFKVSLPIAYEAFEPSELKRGYKEEIKEKNIIIPEEIPESQLTTQNPQLATTNSEKPNQPLALVVEDNPDLRSFISSALQGEFSVIIAENGKVGKELAIKEIPDLIVSDVMMPEMNGFEMTMALKADQHTSHIPIILLTAKGGHENKITGLETGADDYLTKPFEVRELQVRAQNLIKLRQQLRERFSGEIRLKPKEVAVTSVDEQFLNRIAEIMEIEIGNDQFGVSELAREIGMSRSQIHRKLTAITGQSANQLIRNFRLQRARELLEKQAGNVGEIAFEVGFSSPAYFAKCFKDAFGISPSEV